MDSAFSSSSLAALSETTFTQQVNSAFKNYHSVLALSRSPLANSALVEPALVLDAVSPTASERGRALQLVLQWAVERLAPAVPRYRLGHHRPFDDPTWQDPRWWRYNILRHRYLEPLHPDEFIEGGRFTETLIALTGIPSPDTYFDERNRAIQEATRQLRQQFVSGEADERMRQLALDEVLRPLQAEPEALALLGIAATFNDVFPQRLLLQMAVEEQLTGVEAALKYLTMHRFLLTGDEGTNLWLSPIVQTYLYDRQPKARLRRRHRRVAQHYAAMRESLAAADHWRRADEWERAASILLATSSELVNELQIGELSDALCSFKGDQLPPDQWREVQILLSDLYQRLGRQADALAACRRALKATAQAHEQARIYRRMGKLYEKQNHLHALGYYQQAVERFRPDDPELPNLLKDRGWLHMLRGEWAQAEVDLTLALSHAPSASSLRADILDALAGLFRRRKQYEIAIRYAREALVIREESGNLARVASSFNNLGIIYRMMGEYGHAIAAYQEALETYRKLDNQEATAGALLNIGSSHYLAGRLQQAIEQYQLSLDLCRSGNVPHLQAQALYNLAEAHAAIEQVAEARSFWEQGYALSVQCGFDDQIAYFEQLRMHTPSLQVSPVQRSSAITASSSAPSTSAAAVFLEADEQTALELAEQAGQVTSKTLMKAAGVSKATATRRLAELVERGYLQRHGKGRGTYYTLSSAKKTSRAADVRPSIEPTWAEDAIVALLRQQAGRLNDGYGVCALGLVNELTNGVHSNRHIRVRFDTLPSLQHFFELEDNLSKLLGCSVDLKPMMAAPPGEDVYWIWTDAPA